jgi:hypothetical protein
MPKLKSEAEQEHQERLEKAAPPQAEPFTFTGVR